VLVAGLAQAGRQINQARRHDEAGGIDHAVCGEITVDLADGADAARGDGQVANLIEARGGIHQAAVLDEDFHVLCLRHAEVVMGASDRPPSR